MTTETNLMIVPCEHGDYSKCDIKECNGPITVTTPTLFVGQGSNLTPAITQPSVKLRTKARGAERQAARRAIGGAGSSRHTIFMLVAKSRSGMTSREIAVRLAQDTPCQQCGCEHRPPIPVNQIGTRLQELREWGFLAHEMNGKEPLVRDGAEVHRVTVQGLMEI